MKPDSLKNLADEADALLRMQWQQWPEAAGHYAALSQCRERTVEVGGVPVRLQCNPERIRSTASKVDRRSVAQRPCFLCDANRPAEQLSVPVAGRYQLLVNPYPIFPRHFTLPAVEHVPQLLRGRFGDMLQLAAALPACIVFYNGARCGASAPDHMHFQAGNKGFVPIESQWDTLLATQGESRCWEGGIVYSWLTRWPVAMLAFEGDDAEALCAFWERVEALLPVPSGDVEPPVNMLCSFTGTNWRCWAVLRTRHRPRQYDAGGEAQRLVSPGAVDMAGVVITPRETDFLSLSAAELADIYRQVADPSLLDVCLQQLKTRCR